MRDRIVLSLALVLLASSVLSAAAMGATPPKTTATPQKPVLPAGIPVFPGGKVTVEVNLTDKDFLPLIKQFITSFLSAAPGDVTSQDSTDAGKPGETQGISPHEGTNLDMATVAEFRKALAGLRSVSVVAYTVPATVKLQQVADFYVLRVGLNKGWTNSIRVESPKGIIRVYTKPDMEGVFALVVNPAFVGVLRTEGKVDVAVVGDLFGRFAAMGVSLHEKDSKPAETPADPKSADPAPAPSPAE